MIIFRIILKGVTLVVIAMLGCSGILIGQSAIHATGDKSQKVSSQNIRDTSVVQLSTPKFFSDVVEVEDFNAKGDGITDDSKSIQAALDYAAKNRASVHCTSNKTYLVSSIRIKNGTKKFICEGTLKGKGKSAHGILEVDGDNVFKGLPVEDCVISATIDMSAGDIYGIYADCCKKCVFENNYVYGFVDDGNKYGILLTQNSQYNKIRDNKVIGSFNPKNRQFLIMLMGNALPYGNYFDGAGKFARATKPTVANIVSDNFCQYGTHGIVVNAGERDTINNNRLEGQSHRSIALEPACWYDVVTSNTCLEYGSSAVVCGYGCAYNVVAKNICRAGTSKFPLGGEASINFVVGNEGNRIQGNIIDAPKNYGIYLAVDGKANIVEDNEIKNYLRAGIGLESDWERPLPPPAVYSRPNFGPSPTGRWAYGNTEGNVIQNNTIGAPYKSGGSAIYLAQVGSSAALNKNTISGNTVQDSTDLKHYLYVFEETTDLLAANILANNVFLGARPSQFYMSRESGHFKTQKNNGILKDN